LAGQRFEGDIIVTPHKLVIQFDGAYWHEERADKDAAKADALREAGWRCVRIREAPLERTNADDVLVGDYNDESTHSVALQVLKHLRDRLGLSIEGLENYGNAGRLLSGVKADTYTSQLLERDRQKRETEQT
jgi:hypothetical protein